MSLLEQLVCASYFKFSKPTMLFFVLLYQMSYLNTGAEWIEGGMKKVWRKLGCRVWGNEGRTHRIRMEWVELWKENMKKLIRMCCRFALMAEEKNGNVDCTDLFFYRETEVERTAYMVIVFWVDLATVWKMYTWISQNQMLPKLLQFFQSISFLIHKISDIFLFKTTFYFNTCHFFQHKRK